MQTNRMTYLKREAKTKARSQGHSLSLFTSLSVDTATAFCTKCSANVVVDTDRDRNDTRVTGIAITNACPVHQSEEKAA